MCGEFNLQGIPKLLFTLINGLFSNNKSSISKNTLLLTDEYVLLYPF